MMWLIKYVYLNRMIDVNICKKYILNEKNMEFLKKNFRVFKKESSIAFNYNIFYS